MGEDTTAKLARSLARYQALVVGGLCFIVVLAITIMGVMLYLSFSLGNQSAKLEGVAEETHDALCALYQKEITAQRESLPYRNTGLLDARGNVVISAELIQRGIAQRKDTIEALKGSGLTCS